MTAVVKGKTFTTPYTSLTWFNSIIEMSMTRDALLALHITLRSSLTVCNIPFLYNGESSTNFVNRGKGIKECPVT